MIWLFLCTPLQSNCLVQIFENLCSVDKHKSSNVKQLLLTIAYLNRPPLRARLLRWRKTLCVCVLERLSRGWDVLKKTHQKPTAHSNKCLWATHWTPPGQILQAHFCSDAKRHRLVRPWVRKFTGASLFVLGTLSFLLSSSVPLLFWSRLEYKWISSGVFRPKHFHLALVEKWMADRWPKERELLPDTADR